MNSEKVIPFPLRDPALFTSEINRQVLGSSELRRVLYAAIEALPYIEDPRLGEELKEALCLLVAPELVKQELAK